MVYVYTSHYLLRNVIQVHRIVYQLNLYVQIQLVRTPGGRTSAPHFCHTCRECGILSPSSLHVVTTRISPLEIRSK